MKQIFAALVILSSALFGASRIENARSIIETSLLDAQVDPVLQMMAMEAIAASGKKIDAEVLVEEFRKNLNDEKVLGRFLSPYDSLFSDEEIAELRAIYENPVWQKYAREAMPILQAQLQVMKDLFAELASNYAVEEASEPSAVSNEEIVQNAEIIELTQDNFNEVTQASIPTIIDIHAAWCNACRMMDPIVDEMSEKYQGTIQFAKIDIDAQSELAKKYDVTSLPTFVFLKPGQKTPAMKSVGFMSKKDFEAKIQQFLKK